jgi:hypothetical protein
VLVFWSAAWPVVDGLALSAFAFVSVLISAFGSAFMAAPPLTSAPLFISTCPALGWSLAPSADAKPVPAISATAATVARSDFFIPNVSSGNPSWPNFSVSQPTSNATIRSEHCRSFTFVPF